MRPVTFNKKGKLGAGLIAQELQQILPAAVKDGEYLAIEDRQIIAYLIAGWKEHERIINELRHGTTS
jgi:hypothetical protein